MVNVKVEKRCSEKKHILIFINVSVEEVIHESVERNIINIYI